MTDTLSVMTTDVISVNRETFVEEAIEIMVENNVTGLPVVDDENRLVGIISEKDVLKFLSDIDRLMLVKDFKDSSAKVEDFMTEKVISFDVNEDLIAICECLVQNHFRRIPILSEGKLAGIISRKDVIKYILEPI